MSETMSSSPSSDWVQLYERNLSRQAQTKPAATDATTTSASSGLIPEGRMSKPVRKRSRASRRTPTTLLNTDTANFRAMVQRFTGGPASSPFVSGSHYPSGPNVNFGLGTSQNRNTVMVPGAGAGAGINFVQLQQFEEQQYMVSVNNSTSHGGELGFLQSYRPGGVLAVSSGNGMEGSDSSSVRSSSLNNPINPDNYLL